jgi:hypothetical protein
MKSLEIILEKFKEDLITREEAVQLIEDLCTKSTTYSPWYIPVSTPSIWPFTYETEKTFPEYKITCSEHD